MARSYANIFCAIWDDEDFCALSSDAQRTYFMLVTQNDITACGTLALTLRRWARTVREKDRASLEPALDELRETRFILIDEDSEELFVRTFVKHDGGYKHAQRVKAVVAYAEAVRSPLIRTAVAVELWKLGVETAIRVPPDSQSGANREAVESHSGGTEQEVESGRSVVKQGDHRPHSTTHNPGRGPEPFGDAEPPSMFCSKHPNGTEEPCGPCAGARKIYAAWMDTKTRAEVEARKAAKFARQECVLCDDRGMRLDPETRKPIGRCDHQETAS